MAKRLSGRPLRQFHRPSQLHNRPLRLLHRAESDACDRRPQHGHRPFTSRLRHPPQGENHPHEGRRRRPHHRRNHLDLPGVSSFFRMSSPYNPPSGISMFIVIYRLCV